MRRSRILKRLFWEQLHQSSRQLLILQWWRYCQAIPLMRSTLDRGTLQIGPLIRMQKMYLKHLQKHLQRLRKKSQKGTTTKSLKTELGQPNFPTLCFFLPVNQGWLLGESLIVSLSKGVCVAASFSIVLASSNKICMLMSMHRCVCVCFKLCYMYCFSFPFHCTLSRNK